MLFDMSQYTKILTEGTPLTIVTTSAVKQVTPAADVKEDKPKRTRRKTKAITTEPTVKEVKATEITVEKVSELIEPEPANPLDVRVEKQKNRQVSYDVGTKVGGSAKDYHAKLKELEKAFLENPTAQQLDKLAEHDESTANELANRKVVFSWFSMQAAYDRGVEVSAAYGMSLLIRRLPINVKKLNPALMNRERYMKVMEFISAELKTVVTIQQLRHVIKRLAVLGANLHTLEYYEKSIDFKTNRIDVLLEKYKEDPEFYEGLISRIKAEIELAKGYVQMYELNDQTGVRHLDTFTKFIVEPKKVTKFIDTAKTKYSTWEHYFKENTKVSDGEEEEEKPKNVRKPVWERKLPINPVRKGGPLVPEFRKPEDYLLHFNFRAVEMGIWMKDEDALAHLISSGAAYTDLAYILGIDKQHISLGNKLAMAFGARGKSKAAAHFERGFNVINFTKTRGWMGTAAHEFFHAYDYYLSQKLGINTAELLTEMVDKSVLPLEVQFAVEELLNVFREGSCTTHFTINPTNQYRISKVSRKVFEEVDGDMQAFVDYFLSDFDEKVSNSLYSYYSDSVKEKLKAKYARKRTKLLREKCEIAAILHLDKTGEQVYSVPYTIHQTRYYTNAEILDRGKKTNRYWSSDVELAARAFEAYIKTKMNEKGIVSDYLVCGLDAEAYPTGEELERINQAMEKFLEVTLPYLREEPVTTK
ncbi:LPD1 domain-containing protein [Solibacillus sp. NPDC093137]|uniref:LPD1 domain-containing protein n=1 Tax=Solibacillus sp. NPDC093137 TaxID=3390678 RepID=UPI003CFBE3F4